MHRAYNRDSPPKQQRNSTMPVDPRRLLALDLPELEFAWTERDSLLYALATGFGQDPSDERELDFLLERRALRVSPTFAITL